MQYRKLGRTDMAVSVAALGCWTLTGSDYWGEQDEADSIAAIHTSLKAGVNLFDTAEMYGDGASESLLGKVLGSKRTQVVIASKLFGEHLAEDRVAAACEGSLKRLKSDYLDLYQIHWPNPKIPVAETLGAMQRLQQQGKVRAIGVSNFGVAMIDEIVSAGRCESNQLAYNLLLRGIEFNIQDKCLQHDLSILAYSPLAQSLLTGKFHSAEEVPDARARTRHFSKERPGTRHGENGCEAQTFEAIAAIRRIGERLDQPMGELGLAWLLHRAGVASVVAGARNGDQARRNARAAELALSDPVIAELDRATESVKQYLGPSADAWEPVANARIV